VDDLLILTRILTGSHDSMLPDIQNRSGFDISLNTEVDGSAVGLDITDLTAAYMSGSIQKLQVR
jgi:hypothetical protein